MTDIQFINSTDKSKRRFRSFENRTIFQSRICLRQIPREISTRAHVRKYEGSKLDHLNDERNEINTNVIVDVISNRHCEVYKYITGKTIPCSFPDNAHASLRYQI